MNRSQRYSQQRGFRRMEQGIMAWAMKKDADARALEVKKEQVAAALELRKQNKDIWIAKESFKADQRKAEKEEQRGYDEGKAQQKAISESSAGVVKRRRGLAKEKRIANEKRAFEKFKQSLTKKDTPKPYTKPQLVDDTRGYYSLLMDAMKDDDGYVRKESMTEYNNLASNMKADMFAIGNGLMPSWLKKTDEGKKIIETVQKQTGQPVNTIIPNSELPKGMDTRRVTKALFGSPKGVYDVDGIRFRWNGKMAVPYERQVYSGKINPDGSSTGR